MNTCTSPLAVFTQISFSALLLLSPSTRPVMAQSATWLASPGTGDWNTASNWTGSTVPNSSSAVATFGTSSVTALSLSADTQASGLTFNSGASAFTITSAPALVLTISGPGITNSSGSSQSFVTAINGASERGQIYFTNSATAGITTTFSNQGSAVSDARSGMTRFHGTSTAGSGGFSNHGGTVSRADGGNTQFTDNAKAGSGSFTNYGGTVSGAYGGVTTFTNNTTAENGTFTNYGGSANGASGGYTSINGSALFGAATAGSGTFTNYGATAIDALGGGTSFSGPATAGNGIFINYGGTISGNTVSGGAGSTFFTDSANAGSGTFTNYGGTVSGTEGGRTEFSTTASAGNGIFTNIGGTVSGAEGGRTVFIHTATAGNGTFTANGGTGGGYGGSIQFSGDSTGGMAQVEVTGNGTLDISAHNAPGVAIGSIKGTGGVLLGAGNLTVGSNNLSTTFSGAMQDGGWYGGTGGSFTKTGTGTLTLSGANTYTGGTTISVGTVLANNASGSAFGTGAIMLASGATLGGGGFIDGLTTVASGGHLAPGNSPGTLTFTNGLTLLSGAILDFQLGTASDLIAVTGGTLTGPAGNGGITLNLSNSGGFAPGISYTLFNFVSGQTSSFDIADFTFGSLIGTTVASDYSFNLTATSLGITYNGSASAIPEPSAYAVTAAFIALACAVWHRRHRKNIARV